ncbi:hypothetical protein VTN00DRAFT_1206 [Thermoascus crustaceus]|uniref:uncharacterized protein n=1 Tax=Thermoascus crustaceus TaxID=5088 RepID=UPI0037429F4A
MSSCCFYFQYTRQLFLLLVYYSTTMPTCVLSDRHMRVYRIGEPGVSGPFDSFRFASVLLIDYHFSSSQFTSRVSGKGRFSQLEPWTEQKKALRTRLSIHFILRLPNIAARKKKDATTYKSGRPSQTCPSIHPYSIQKAVRKSQAQVIVVSSHMDNLDKHKQTNTFMSIDEARQKQSTRKEITTCRTPNQRQR